jgi:putative membrane protein
LELEEQAMPRATPPVLAAVCISALATTAFAASDKAFLKKALEGDNAEVALGQMAEHNGASQATKAFGHMLAVDHADHKAKVLPIAAAHGVSDTQAMGAGGRIEEVKLKLLEGPSFDREFARYMVHDHQNDIAAFRQEAQAGDPATAALAKQTLPILNKHLDTAQKLVRQTGA